MWDGKVAVPVLLLVLEEHHYNLVVWNDYVYHVDFFSIRERHTSIVKMIDYDNNSHL